MYGRMRVAVKATVDHIRGMSREDPPLRIRLPEALKSTIQVLAAESRRSMNAEIVRRLEWSLEADQAATDRSKAAATDLLRIGSPDADRLDKLETEVEGLKKRIKAMGG